VSYIS